MIMKRETKIHCFLFCQVAVPEGVTYTELQVPTTKPAKVNCLKFYSCKVGGDRFHITTASTATIYKICYRNIHSFWIPSKKRL